MFTKFEEKMNVLYDATNGKNIIIWGWGWSGRFLHMCMTASMREVACVIDEGQRKREQGTKTHHILDYYDPETTIILVTAYEDVESILDIAAQYGYDSKNIILTRELFYGTEAKREIEYYQWLEYEYGVDLVKRVSLEDQGYIEGEKIEYHNYWASRGIGLENVLKRFHFNEEDAVFDFGCGKAASLIMFKKAGICRGGGIEYDRMVYESAVDNMKTLGMDFPIVCGDASAYTDIDDYNYFYMFDPFVGECFKKVIINIQESYKRKKRKIVLIYSAPQCHKAVVEDGMFRFSYQMENVLATTGTTNVYVLE